MADTKITALTAITTVDPAADVLPIVDVSDTSMAASGTTKKITTNQLLGASGTATLASATITGDLTVKTNVLKVDTTNNRVGIGTASPAVLFHAALPAATFGEVGRFYDSSGNGISFTANAGSGFNQITSTGAQPLIVNVNSSERYRLASDGVATWSNVGGVAGTAMTLNSTGLGVGVVSSNGIKLSSFVTTDGAPATSGTTQTSGSLRIGATSTTGAMDMGTAGSYSWIQVLDRGNLATNYDLVLQKNGGNVGIGVTPSASWTGGAVIQQQNGAVYANSSLGSYDFSYNSIRTASNSYVYAASSLAAARFQLRDGAFNFFTAPSGTAGNAITYTQAMTLDASGNLGIGINTPTYKLDTQVAGGADRSILRAAVTGVSGGFNVNWNHATLKTRVIIENIPTSSAGLPAGTLWNDAGTIKIA